MINRKINNVELEIDPLEGDAIYFLEEDASNLKDFDIESIISYIHSKGDGKYIPLCLTIELTNKCNYNCSFCYINNNESKSNPTKFYRFNNIKNDLAWLIDKGLLYCTITGGEPLIHPDFKELYLFLKNKGVLINLFTNLSCLKEDSLDLILTYPPFKLETTMYAFSDLQYKNITEQSAFLAEDFKRKILFLKQHNINIICKTPLNISTIEEFKLCKEWCEENEVEYYFSDNVSNTYNGTDLHKYELSMDEKLIIRKEKIKDTQLLDLNQFGVKRAFECGAGEYSLFISYDYRLRPCMSFHAIKDANFEIEFNKIEDAYNAMLKFINRYKGQTLTFCCGCNAKNICKICIIDELSYNQTGCDYCKKCSENKYILEKLIKL